ncbi:MAG TPA: MFS transporter [Anaerolineaceae bacterium]|nr:MFS transporter [Anaerolineaceae bacterium]
MAQTFTRNRVTWLAYTALAFYGYFINIFGPITPFLKDELKLSYTVSSFHFSAFALGMIGAGMFGHLLVERAGRWTTLWIGVFGMSLSALLLSAGREPLLTIGVSFFMGLIGSVIIAVVSSTLSDQHREMRAVAISEANVVSSVISAMAPLLVGWFAPTGPGWRAALLVGAVASLVMRLAFRRVNIPPSASPARQGQSRRPLRGLYWVYWTGIVLAVSIEFCMIYWSADYLEKSLGMPKATAAQAVSLFLLGMIAGRFASSRLVQRFPSHLVVTGSLLIAAAGFLVYWTASSPLLGAIGLLICGLGVASLYPLLLSLAIGSAGEDTVQASARSSLASGLAIFALPLVLGRLADAVGIHQAYMIIIFLVLGVLVINLITARFVDSHKTVEVKSS